MKVSIILRIISRSSYLPIMVREQLIDIKTDSKIKEKFSCTNILRFWANLVDEYPAVSNI